MHSGSQPTDAAPSSFHDGRAGVPPLAVAYARHFEAASAVAQCVAQLGASVPTLLVVFCGGKHDPHLVREALRQSYGAVDVVGGSAAGAISGSNFGYSGLELAVLAFFDPGITPVVLLDTGLSDSEFGAGERLGAGVAAVATPGALVLLLYDSVATGAPLRLHYASWLVAGFELGLGAKPVELVGGGLLTDLKLSDGWVFCGQDIHRHAAVVLVFPAGVRASTVVLHGCRPVSTFMQITRIEGAEVFELDGEPALAVIERMLHVSIGGTEGNALTLLATLGEKQGDPFAPYDENAYVNRLILSSDRGRGSVTLFEPDFRLGAMVQIMSRDNSLMLQSVRDGVDAVNRTPRAGRPLFRLYVDCAGRASAFTGAPVEEAEMVLNHIDQVVPLIGFYSGVEIAPFDGYSRPLDWTGMLTTVNWDP